MFRRLVVDVVVEVLVLALGDMELTGHGVEHVNSLQTVITAKLHQTKQQQRLFFLAYLAV